MNGFERELEAALEQVEQATEGEAVAMTVADIESDMMTGPVDEGLVKQYTELMQEFVRRNSQKLLLERLSDGNFSVPAADDPTVVEARAMRRERHQQVLSKLMATFDELQTKSELVKIRRAALRAQKQDLIERANEFRRAQEDRREAELFGDNSSSSSPGSGRAAAGFDGGDDAEDVEELNREGERLLVAQQRSAELQAQIERVKRKNLTLTRALQAKSENLPPEIRHCLNDQGPVTESTMSTVATLLHELKEQNAHMEAKIAEHSEMTEFYTGMRECLEELRGVRVLYVKNSSLPSGRWVRRQALKCAFMLLDKYELEVELQSLDSTREGNKKAGDEQSPQLLPVKASFRNLNLSLDDLVVSTKPSSADLYMYSNGADRLRRIVTEALARIHLHQQRARHLQQLQAMPGIQVAVAGTKSATDGEGGQENVVDSLADMQWVCRLHDSIGASTASDTAAVAGWVAVLTLTPDCPIIPGSVRLSQLYYLNDEGVEEEERPNSSDTLKRINETLFASPIELVVALAKELLG